MSFYQVIVFIIGACIGSFLNVCIYRLPRGQSVVYKPSHCPGCDQRLKALDLVPLLSYVLLKGRCRYCNEKISVRYPLVELISALLFVAAYQFWGWQWQTLSMWVFFAALISAALIDFRHKIIPDEIVIVGCMLGLPLVFLADKLVDGIIGFFAAGLFFLFLAVGSKGGIGGGDIKLSALMGLYLGCPAIFVAVFSSFLFGGIISILLMALRCKRMKDSVPFGPFMAIGGVVAAFYTDPIIKWYLDVAMY